ncbi:MAG: glutamate-5-semialdehyde dehydrogenase [Bacteroidaceae bacterium]|nr:glutamate-5-semialdehyde dehydrogenase [Bacteroidaceae bacterium]
MTSLSQSFSAVRAASRRLLELAPEAVDAILRDVADATEQAMPTLLAANQSDLRRMSDTDPRYDRLRLTEQRLADIAHDLRAVAALPSPLGRILCQTTRPNGLRLQRITVPFGVIGIIFEARPNVCFDCFSLCLKAGSACILKGGSDASDTCQAIVRLIHEVLRRHGLPAETVLLLTTHEATDQLLAAHGDVDLIIPRGSQRLIEYVRTHARVPVIETGAGVVHCYVDRAADLAMATAIVENAKTRRVSVCNALDCLIVHSARLADLPALCQPLFAKGVVIEADKRAFAALADASPAALLQPANEEGAAGRPSFGTEFLALRMAIKTVDTLDEALRHIARYGSGHSETIVTEDEAAARRFQQEVDAACVYWNAPTSFTDGAQFGLGAEIGISTQKLHARGPMALDEIVTYKWLIRGNGQTRP